MSRVLSTARSAAKVLHAIAGASLVFVMLLTITDVVLRAFGRPILGAYELVGYAGGIAIGLAMPMTSWRRAHVYVDAFVLRLPAAARLVLHVATRLLGAGLFAVLAWNLVLLGLDLRRSGEVSPTLELEFYPVVFGLAAAAVLQAIVLLCQIAAPEGGENE